MAIQWQDGVDKEWQDSTTAEFQANGDTLWEHVSFLLGNGEGTDAATPAVEASRHARALYKRGTSAYYDSTNAPAGNLSGMPIYIKDAYLSMDLAPTVPHLGSEASPNGYIFELEMRYYSDEVSWPGGNTYLYDNGDTSYGGTRIALLHEAATGGLSFYVNSTRVVNHTSATSTKAWNHVVIGYDGTQWYMHVNGTRIGTYTGDLNWIKQYNGIGSYFGGSDTTYGFEGWVEMVRYTNTADTVRYGNVASHTVPSAVFPKGVYTEPTSDAHWANVEMLLMNGEGTDGGTTFTDQSDAGTSISKSGSPEYDTGVTGLAAASWLATTRDDGLYYSHGLSSGEAFTSECRYRLSQASGVHYVMSMRSGSAGTEWAVYEVNGVLYVWAGSAIWSSSLDTTAGGDFYHIAITFDPSAGATGKYYFHLNGMLRIAWNANPGTWDPQIWWGTYWDTAANDYAVIGNIEMIRFTAGVARYSAHSFDEYDDVYATGAGGGTPQTVTIGLAEETNEALQLLIDQLIELGVAVEVNEGLGLGAGYSVTIGYAAEDNDAYALGAGYSATIGVASEEGLSDLLTALTTRTRNNLFFEEHLSPIKKRGKAVLNQDLEAGQSIEIFRHTPINNPFNAEQYKPFPTENLEFAMDTLTMISQEAEAHLCACEDYPVFEGTPVEADPEEEHNLTYIGDTI